MKISKKTMQIWEDNLKKGWRFFQPHNAKQATPRTEREADAQRNLLRFIQQSK